MITCQTSPYYKLAEQLAVIAKTDRTRANLLFNERIRKHSLNQLEITAIKDTVRGLLAETNSGGIPR